MTIRNEGNFFTACSKIPFVNVADVAAVAFHAPTDTKPSKTDPRILGPKPFTYDEVYGSLLSLANEDLVNVDRVCADCGQI